MLRGRTIDLMPPDSSDRKPMDPDAVAGQSFTTVRKGYEPDEVRAFQLSVASVMRETKLRYEDMERRLAEVERRAADPRDLDEHAVTQLLGEETARVLETARQAANDIRARAEAGAVEREATLAERERLSREAADSYSEATRSAADEADRRIRADADSYSQEVRAAADAETVAQRAAADEYSERIRSAADSEVASLRATASAEAERLRAEAASVLTERTAEAETAASAILGEADAYSTRVRADADRYSEATRAAADSYRSDTQAGADAYKADATAEGDRLRSEGEDAARRMREEADEDIAARAAKAEADARDALDAARDQGRQMVEEARNYRERVIADLADRRRTARGQLDAVAATRDALAVAMSDVASNLATSHRQLTDLNIDSTLLGDAATDRETLEANDRPLAAADSIEAEGDSGAPDDSDATEAVAQARDGLADGDLAHGDLADGDLATADDDSDEASEVVVDDELDTDDAALAGIDSDSVVGLDDAATEHEADDGPSEAPASEKLLAEAVVDLTAADPTDPASASAVIDLTEPELAESEPDTVEDDDEASHDAPTAEVQALASSAEIEADEADEADEAHETDGDTVAGSDVETADDGGQLDPREGRIDDIFARIRADRRDETEPETEPQPEPADPAEATGDGEGSATTDASATGETAAQGAVDGAGVTSDSDPDVDLLDRRDGALEQIEKQLARRLKRVLADEQNEALDLLRRTKATPTADNILPTEADHQERYRSAALEDLSDAERVGAGFYGEVPDHRADVFDVAGDFASEILRQIRAQLVRALDDGGDEYELGDRIRACYREWKTQRIAETARHFVMVAFSRGVAEAAEDGSEFRWLMDDGDQPCPDCDDNQIGGAVTKGTAFPTGDLTPPAHPGCRCLTVPVE